MKPKLLLFLVLFTTGILNAQEVYRSLIISEVRYDRNENAYVEVSNVGNKDVMLSDFRLNYLGDDNLPWTSAEGQRLRLPENTLKPGESFVVALVKEFQDALKEPYLYSAPTKPEMFEIADVLLYKYITPGYELLSKFYNGGDGLFLEQFVTEEDSVVIDQVGGVFDGADGTNGSITYDVAGVRAANRSAILIRKFNVKEGNLTFVRGIDIKESEWIPILFSYNPNPAGMASATEADRKLFWTVGNHGDYNLNENTLVSEVADIDWENKIISVPWGVRNLDDFMNVFEKQEGIAWHYHLSPAREDSAYCSARTGDKITLYACGNDLDEETFEIVVNEPTADANIVVPKYAYGEDGIYPVDIISGNEEVFMVTEGNSDMDTIFDIGIVGYPGATLAGMTYATNVDSLFKYLEKPANANWEIDWIDGVKRTSLKNGDKLKVTSENNSVKNYFIKVHDYEPSHDATLGSITWPDIPDFYKGIFGWIGDTIPGFSSNVTNYNLEVPLDVEGIPAIVGKTTDLNASFDVKKATSLRGTVEDRTATFTVTAEDDTTILEYNIQMSKEKHPDDKQPFYAEPFISEVVHHEQFNNDYIEICNPGTEALDLSNYMILRSVETSPGNAIKGYSDVVDWRDRYIKYIPGYKYGNETEWQVNPGILQPDVAVNSIVMPGDVFVLGHIHKTQFVDRSPTYQGYPWFASEACDVEFNLGNPWNEEVRYDCARAHYQGSQSNLYIMKILNDSIKRGLKAPIDPEDFEMVDIFGDGTGEFWDIGGFKSESHGDYRNRNWIRKPNYYKGVPEFGGSFGTNEENSEWLMSGMFYWNTQPIPEKSNNKYIYCCLDLGKHFLNDITEYLSTVNSVTYLVSEGYSQNETIRGVQTGTTVTEFLDNIIKSNQNQSLKLHSGVDGTALANEAILSMNDTLVVLSADSVNTTKYALEVTEQGLNSDARLTSSVYEINIVDEPKSADEENTGTGTISGFEYGTTLSTILNNVTVPTGASLMAVDKDGAYVPLQMLNFDTSYVYVTVNEDIYLDVIAEDGVTSISYELIPGSAENDAFVLSYVYNVQQGKLAIEFVPRGTAPQVFLSNLIVPRGASVKLVDKLGNGRMDGHLVQDDKLIVTAADGTTTKVYYLAMLATEPHPTPIYLAYVTSNRYTVDQAKMVIGGATGSTPIADFYNRIDPAFGANAIVLDMNGAIKASGDLDDGDVLQVTSADGKVVATYDLALDLTTSDLLSAGEIILYPNPSTGKVNISGLNPGARIQVFNPTGAVLNERIAGKTIETVSLDNQPSGIYIIMVTDTGKFIGNYKVIKR